MTKNYRGLIMRHQAVHSMWQEQPTQGFGEYDGDYWLRLHDKWCCSAMNCHTIHEPTLKEVWLMVIECVRCACHECEPENPRRLDGCRCEIKTKQEDN